MTASYETDYFTIRGRTIPYIPIISEPTPIHLATFRGNRFYIKREDLTDTSIYGGNKVRNLEFILASALLRGKLNIATPIPAGSNFSAAFTGHAKKLGLHPILCQVELANHPQIEDHFQFCQALGPSIKTRRGIFKFPAQFLDIAESKYSRDALIVPPGGSNVLGVIGHIKAFLELADEVKGGLIPCPAKIFVGAGTGGTTAGLIAGVTITGLPIEIIAVRCADPLICNRGRFLRLAKSALRFLGVDKEIDTAKFKMKDCDEERSYGKSLGDFDDIFREFYLENKIELDRTYTSKVIKTMTKNMSESHGLNQNFLYWHTFSSMASREIERCGHLN